MLHTEGNRPFPGGVPNARLIDGVRFCRVSGLLQRAYARRILRPAVVGAALRLEGGQLFSGTLRRILAAWHGVHVGAYSYGEALIPGRFPPGVTVGRYVSIAPGVTVFLRNHPLERLSLHPFFYNQTLGFVPRDTIDSGRLAIEHDAWLGDRAIITPGCSRVGLGAVVGAGAVVTRDVPDFAVVAGNPARLIRFRFPEETQELIRQSRWWERRVEDCVQFISDMVRPLGDQPRLHPLLAAGVVRGSGP